MAEHLIDIDINDTFSPSTLRVQDASSYDANAPLSNQIIEILSPGFVKSVMLRVQKGFNLVLNPSTLKMSPLATGALPDGIYQIKYSVAPNLSKYIQYNYFRNFQQNSNWRDLVTSLFEKRSNYTKEEFGKKMRELEYIKDIIDGAKYMAEDVNDNQTAVDMYNEAAILLTKFKNFLC